MKQAVVIEAPKFEIVKTTIVGDTKLVLHKFSSKARQMIMDKQSMGAVANKGKKKEPRDFNMLYEGALYLLLRDGMVSLRSVSVRR